MDAPINHSSRVDPTITAFRQKLVEKEEGINQLYHEVCAPKAAPASTVWGRVFTATKDAAVEQCQKVAMNLFALSLKSLQSDLNELFKKGTVTYHQFGLLTQEIQRQSQKVERIGDALRNIRDPEVRSSEASKMGPQDETVEKVKSFNELSHAKLQNGEWEQSVETNAFFYQSFNGYFNYLKNLFRRDHGNSVVTYDEQYLPHLLSMKIAIERSLEMTTHQKDELVANIKKCLGDFIFDSLPAHAARLSESDKKFVIDFGVQNLLNVGSVLDRSQLGKIRYHVCQFCGGIADRNKDLVKSFEDTLLFFDEASKDKNSDDEFEFAK